MLSLIKTDFKRVLGDKLFLVMCILAGVFALITPLLYLILFGMETDPMTAELLGGLGTAKGVFFDAFSLGNNFGLIGPVFLSIVLMKDFSFGTIRNKIISGHSRSSIYLSMFTVCAAIMFGVVFLHALVSFGVGVFILELGIEASDIGYVLLSLLLEFLLYLAVSAFICWLCAAMKNVGLVIVLYVAAAMALSMVASIIMMIIIVLEADGVGETAVKILEVVQNINIFNYGTIIGKGDSYEKAQLCYLLFTPIVTALGFLGFGVLKFNKKDIK